MMPFKFVYTLGDNIMTRVDVQKDLGIFIDSRLTFVPHVNSIIKKANHMSVLVGATFAKRRMSVFFLPLFCYLIRPNFEFCTVVFNSISAHLYRNCSKLFIHVGGFTIYNLTYVKKTRYHPSDINDLLMTVYFSID